MKLEVEDISNYLAQRERIKQALYSRARKFIIDRDGSVHVCYLDVSEDLKVTYFNECIPWSALVDVCFDYKDLPWGNRTANSYKK